MKQTTKYILLTLAWTLAFAACHKVPIGYLITEYGSYEIDSLVVKSELDITPPEVIPNPEYEMLIGFGIPPADIISWGIYPTISIGGGEDYDRHRLGIPWTSTPIEGVEGTMPILASIRHVTTDVGNTDKLLEYITVRGNGVFTIPLENDIPKGRYKISLTFTNEGYSKSIDDVFTVIVK